MYMQLRLTALAAKLVELETLRDDVSFSMGVIEERRARGDLVGRRTDQDHQELSEIFKNVNYQILKINERIEDAKTGAQMDLQNLMATSTQSAMDASEGMLKRITGEDDLDV